MNDILHIKVFNGTHLDDGKVRVLFIRIVQYLLPKLKSIPSVSLFLTKLLKRVIVDELKFKIF